LAAPVLYTALVDGLTLRSMVASWPYPRGSCAPLDPDAYPTKLLLDSGSIELAAPGAVDNTTPAHTLRGQPGLHIGVAN
jgi:hypothetical protein